MNTVLTICTLVIFSSFSGKGSLPKKFMVCCLVINIFISGGSCEKAYPRFQRTPVPLSRTEGRLEPKKLLTGELSHDGIIRMLRSDKQRTGPQDGAYMRSILRTLKINRDGFARTIQMK